MENPVPRRMYQPWVEGDLFNAHAENHGCAQAGCVPEPPHGEEGNAPNGLAAYRSALEGMDATAPLQNYRIDLLKWGWCVKAQGEYVGEFHTRKEAQRWLAGLLLAASTVEEDPDVSCS